MFAARGLFAAQFSSRWRDAHTFQRLRPIILLFGRNTPLIGERRIIAYGVVAGRVLVCVYTWRGSEAAPLRWTISLRKANRGETNAYRIVFSQ
jgi:uncharacterized DUF497 family protein